MLWSDTYKCALELTFDGQFVGIWGDILEGNAATVAQGQRDAVEAGVAAVGQIVVFAPVKAIRDWFGRNSRLNVNLSLLDSYGPDDAIKVNVLPGSIEVLEVYT